MPVALPLVPAPLAPFPVPFALPGAPLASVFPGIRLPLVVAGVVVPLAAAGFAGPADPVTPPLVPTCAAEPVFVAFDLPVVVTLVALFRPDIAPLVFETDAERFFAGFFLLRELLLDDAVERCAGVVDEPDTFAGCASTAAVIAALESINARTAAKSRFIKMSLW